MSRQRSPTDQDVRPLTDSLPDRPYEVTLTRSRVRVQPGRWDGRYFQRLMNSTVAGLTSSGFEALRKCWPASTM